jgi:hypothetical protein
MQPGNWTVAKCPACGDLHPIHFDGYAGIDGAHVFDCPVAGRLEISDSLKLQELVSVHVQREEA